jgi:hypothetical protein
VKSAASFTSIVGGCICTWFGADCDDSPGDDGAGDGVIDDNHSIISTYTSKLAILMLSSKLPQT